MNNPENNPEELPKSEFSNNQIFEEVPDFPLDRHTTQIKIKRGAKKRKFKSHAPIAIFAIVIFVAILGFLGRYYYTTAIDYQSDFSSPKVLVIIPEGSTGTEIAQILTNLGVTASKNSFTTALKHSAQASDLSYGNFYLPKHISGADALRLLLDKHSQAKITFTIPEGKTVFGTVDATVNSLSQSEVLQDVNPTDDTKLRSDIVQAIKMNRSLLPPVAEGSFEGWLFPATYEIDSYDPDKIAMQMIKKTIAVLQEKQVPESQWQTVITKASIVQKEVTKVDDMKKVAQVIENRLDSDMVLGMDTIVAYGINGGRESSGLELNQSDLDDPSNKYNARIHKGLPPTPISSPGEDAIDAVLNPEEGDWLYFCTVNPETGETEFSETEEEFEVSRNKYKTWLAQNPDYM